MTSCHRGLDVCAEDGGVDDRVELKEVRDGAERSVREGRSCRGAGFCASTARIGGVFVRVCVCERGGEEDDDDDGSCGWALCRTERAVMGLDVELNDGLEENDSGGKVDVERGLL